VTYKGGEGLISSYFSELQPIDLLHRTNFCVTVVSVTYRLTICGLCSLGLCPPIIARSTDSPVYILISEFLYGFVQTYCVCVFAYLRLPTDQRLILSPSLPYFLDVY